MRFEGVVDMYQTVNMLRTQRPFMVQSEVFAVFDLQIMTAFGKTMQNFVD